MILQGYSFLLVYLTELIDILKIDRSFISKIGNTNKKRLCQCYDCHGKAIGLKSCR